MMQEAPTTQEAPNLQETFTAQKAPSPQEDFEWLFDSLTMDPEREAEMWRQLEEQRLMKYIKPDGRGWDELEPLSLLKQADLVNTDIGLCQNVHGFTMSPARQ